MRMLNVKLLSVSNSLEIILVWGSLTRNKLWLSPKMLGYDHGLVSNIYDSYTC